MQNSLVFLLTAAFLGLWAYAGFHPEEMSLYLMYGSYYMMLTLFLAWVYAGVRCLQSLSFSTAAFLRRYGPGLLLCLFMTGAMWLSVKPSFKTLPDETDLLSTSESMVFRKTSVMAMRGVRRFGNFNPGLPALDHRPFFFPFIEGLLHTARGFDPANAFLANAIVAFCFLSGVYICARQTLGWPISFAAVILVASIPLFSICATSGGMDLASCFFYGLSLAVVYSYLQGPTSEKFAVLWMSLLALGNTRYESIVFFFLILGLLAALGRVKIAYLKANRVLVAMTPLWLSLTVWERLVNPQFVNDPTVQHFFGTAYFHQHFLEFLRSQVNFHFDLPFIPILNLLAFTVAAWLLVAIVIQKRVCRTPELRRFALIAALSVAAQFVITLSFVWGSYFDPVTVRYYLPFTVACAVLPLFWLATWAPETRAKLSTPILLCSIGLFYMYHPIAVEGRFVNLIHPSREVWYAQEVLARQYPEKNIVVIAETPEEFTALEYGAADFATANANRPSMLAGLARHAYREIIVVQRIFYATQAPDPKDALDPAYRLQTLSEYSTATESYVRISRVRA